MKDEGESIFSVSVVIATYNREACLFDACNSLLDQDYNNFKIIIVDQSEIITERKRDYFRKHPEITIYYLDQPNRCRAKSHGVRQSQADIVIICDDDIVCQRNLISTHVRHYSESSIGGGCCRVYEEGLQPTTSRNILKISFYGRIIREAHSTTSCRVDCPDGPNMSYRRSIFDRAGYFDEAFIGTGIMEEHDMAIRVRRLGYKIFFDASTTVLHFPQQNGNVVIKNKNQVGWYHSFFTNFAYYHRKHKLRYRLIFFFPFNLLLTVKVMLQHKLSLSDGVFMLKGYFNKVD
jgi:GT2 family glycosyltransferase